jgi:hypothetical protein
VSVHGSTLVEPRSIARQVSIQPEQPRRGRHDDVLGAAPIDEDCARAGPPPGAHDDLITGLGQPADELGAQEGNVRCVGEDTIDEAIAAVPRLEDGIPFNFRPNSSSQESVDRTAYGSIGLWSEKRHATSGQTLSSALEPSWSPR